jgi:hypothetical protein
MRWIVAPALALAMTSGPHAQSVPIFQGTAHDCDGDNFGGHLPPGYKCRGAGTGVGSCFKPGTHRIISYDVQDYCHLDSIPATKKELDQLRRYIECKGANPDCAATAFGRGLR